jgi:hypothetical protein
MFEEIEYNSNNWITMVHDINREIHRFKQVFQERSIEARATCTDDWNEFFNSIQCNYFKNIVLTYEKDTKYMFGEPKTLEDFANKALKMLLSICLMTSIQKTNIRGKITINFKLL